MGKEERDKRMRGAEETMGSETTIGLGRCRRVNKLLTILPGCLHRAGSGRRQGSRMTLAAF